MKSYLRIRKRGQKFGYTAIKLDMEKAYDRIDWNFITKCFQNLGFADK